MGTNDRETWKLNVGFVNCRRWWSREVDLKYGFEEVLCVGISGDVEKDEVSLAGYVWYERNREGGRQANDGVGVW